MIKWLGVLLLLIILNSIFYGSAMESETIDFLGRTFSVRIKVDDSLYRHFARDFSFTFIIILSQILYFRNRKPERLAEERLFAVSTFAMVAFIVGYELGQSVMGLYDIVIGIVSMRIAQETTKKMFYFY